MAIVVSEFSLGKYKVLDIKGQYPKTKYTKYVIDGKKYDIVPVYDMPNCIAIESKESFKGKNVEFH